MPLILGPVGLAGMFATRAEVQAARAAEAAGIAFVESTVSICPIEEVAAATTRPPWFQLYVMRDRAYAEDLMARASAVGSPVLVLTVDLPVVGARHRDTRNAVVGAASRAAQLRRGLDLISHPTWVRTVGRGGGPLTFGNLERAVPDAATPADFREWVDAQFDPSVTWHDLAWVREHWRGRVAVKGILDVDDARRAADAGVDAIVVSNHGGRQLDSVPSTLTVLPQIADAVGGRDRGARRRRYPQRPRHRQDARARRTRSTRRPRLGMGRRGARAGRRGAHDRRDACRRRHRARPYRLPVSVRARPRSYLPRTRRTLRVSTAAD